MDAPRLPRTEDDLADWAVYADYLLGRGDPLGELIAMDLALPATPTKEQLAPFHALAKRLCRPRQTPIGWMLGFARRLEVQTQPQFKSPGAPTGPLASARDFLRSPQAARLEELVTDGVRDPRDWPTLLGALPPTCRRVVLAPPPRALLDLEPALAFLPETVRELALASGGPVTAIDDRFDVVELRIPFDANMHAVFASRLAATCKVRLRVLGAKAGDLPWGRIDLGGDAALIGKGRVIVLRANTSLVEHQHRFGFVGVRAQLARTLPARVDAPIDIVRRPDRWTYRRNGEELVELRDGERVTYGEEMFADGEVMFTFVTRDIAGACLAALTVPATK